MRQIILDTETTGLSPSKGHRITEIGCLEVIDRRETGRRFHTYLNPEREIDEGALRVTGLTVEFLKDKPKFSEVVEDFVAFLDVENTEVIIHNAPFDLGFLNSELERLNHSWCPVEDHVGVIDTLIMARRMHPGQRNNLDVLCRRYNVDASKRDYHGALLDAKLLSQVYLAMTAGQTSFALGSVDPATTGVSERPTEVKVKRTAGIALSVIRANQKEVFAHRKRLTELQEAFDEVLQIPKGETV